MKVIKYEIVFILFIISSCIPDQKSTSIISTKAEITNIFNITDTSAYVNVKVTQQSNAEAIDGFGIAIDSISAAGISYPLLSQSVGLCSDTYTLDSSYTAIMTHLKNNTKYSIYLSFTGEWDIGGPNQTFSFDIGSPKTFTTN